VSDGLFRRVSESDERPAVHAKERWKLWQIEFRFAEGIDFADFFVDLGAP